MQIAAYLIFPILMAYAAASDLLYMRLPNWLTLALALSFPPLAASFQMPFAEIGAHLLCGSVVLVGGFALFGCGWIGGGDAKLAAAIAAWIGFENTADFLVVGALLGGALTLLILLWRRVPVPSALHGEAFLLRLHDRKEGVPYGVALAAAALHVYPMAPIWRLIVET